MSTKLFYLPGTCSLGIHVLLNELGQEVELIHRKDVPNYTEISPTNAVPAIQDDQVTLTEGAAIVLYLLEKYENSMLGNNIHERAKAIEWLKFANATVHPAYSKLFFANSLETGKQEAIDKAAQKLNAAWKIVDNQLAKTRFLGGDSVSAADILLTVYANWGLKIVSLDLGENVRRMIKEVSQRPSFQKALEAEEVSYLVA